MSLQSGDPGLQGRFQSLLWLMQKLAPQWRTRTVPASCDCGLWLRSVGGPVQAGPASVDIGGPWKAFSSFRSAPCVYIVVVVHVVQPPQPTGQESITLSCHAGQGWVAVLRRRSGDPEVGPRLSYRHLSGHQGCQGRQCLFPHPGEPHSRWKLWEAMTMMKASCSCSSRAAGLLGSAEGLHYTLQGQTQVVPKGEEPHA